MIASWRAEMWATCGMSPLLQRGSNESASHMWSEIWTSTLPVLYTAYQIYSTAYRITCRSFDPPSYATFGIDDPQSRQVNSADGAKPLHESA